MENAPVWQGKRLAEMEQLGKRRWRITGWRIWTIVLITIGSGATYLAQMDREDTSILSMIASVSLGAAILTGFLWKLIGEHSLTLIEVKDSVLTALKQEHENEIKEHKKTIDVLSAKIDELTSEVMQIKEFNLMLQKDKLSLEEAVRQYRDKIHQLEKDGQQKSNQIKALEETLKIAERQLALTR